MSDWYRVKAIRRNWKVWASVTVGVGLLGFVLFTIYQYLQLEDAFRQQEEFIPTRFYSDVTEIQIGMRHRYVAERLNRLHYSLVETSPHLLSFKTRLNDFPKLLLPDSYLAPPESVMIEIHFRDDLVSEIRLVDSDSTRSLDLFILEPELIATLTRAGSEGTNEIRRVLKLSEVPSAVWKAIIAVEDQHFLDHQGFDPRGLARAIWVNLKTLSLKQGGSTLTQQLVKNLLARRNKNILKKLSELFLSILLEIRHEKEEILERYLNEVYLGQIGALEVHGVAEGARFFFGKELRALNLAEIAMLAGLIRGPGYYSPYRHWGRAIARQRIVLEKMVETGQIAKREMELALEQPIRLRPPPTAGNLAPFFTDFVKAELIEALSGRFEEQELVERGLRVYTTLDPHWSALTQEELRKGVDEVETRLGTLPGMLEGALASVDPTTGFVKALHGGRNYNQSTFNRILNMKRQVGSTFKPFVYLAAFLGQRSRSGVPIGPGFPILDAPWTHTFDRGKQRWSPKNYDEKFRGWVSLEEALIHSLNIPVAKLGVFVGIESVAEVAQNLGIRTPMPLVPSLTLGVAELSPVELLNAYSTLAANGRRTEMTVVRAITENSGKILARHVPRTSQAVDHSAVEALNRNLLRVVSDGTGRAASSYGIDFEVAGKTGTTSDNRDSWFAGFTPKLATVVWVGPDRGEVKITLTGSSAALPIWSRAMSHLKEREPQAPFPDPTEAVELNIDRHTGLEAKWRCPDSQILTLFYPRSQEPNDDSCASEYSEELTSD